MDAEMILGVLVVFLLAVVLFMCWLYAHARCRRQRRLAEDAGINGFAEGGMKVAQRKGLDKAMIEALPIFIYKSNEENESLENLQRPAAADKGGSCSSSSSCSQRIECPVCLWEFQHNERGRVLPNCKHRFHVDCIDTWLCANATCPVCRASCAGADAEVALQVINGMGIEYPTNVLFWGSNSRVNARVSLDGLQQAPASSSIIQVYTQELPLGAAPSPSSRISTLNPLRRLLSRERGLPSAYIGPNISPSIGTHSPSTHILIPKDFSHV